MVNVSNLKVDHWWSSSEQYTVPKEQYIMLAFYMDVEHVVGLQKLMFARIPRFYDFIVVNRL